MRLQNCLHCACLGVLLSTSEANQFRLSQLVEGDAGGTIEPPLFSEANSSINIGVWLPIRGVFSGADRSTSTPTAIYGRWYGVLVIEAAFQSWLDGSVLEPPVQKAPFNYQLVSYDSCPTPLNADGRCSASHSASYALSLTQGDFLKDHPIPTMRALIGGGVHSALLAETAGTNHVPVVDFESNLEVMSDKRRFPNYMRTNPVGTMTLRALAELIGGYFRYTRTNGLFCQVEQGLEEASTMVSLMEEQGVQINAFYLPPIGYAGWPSGTEYWRERFSVYNPEKSAQTYVERQAIITEARQRNAHVWLNYLTRTCGDLDIIFELALAGFEGPGYLWAGEYLDFGGSFPLYLRATSLLRLEFGMHSPFWSLKPMDGYICAASRSPGMTPKQSQLYSTVHRLLEMNNTLEEWYWDELGFVEKGFLFFEESFYFLFDALWSVFTSINELLLTHGGATFDDQDLFRRLMEVDFDGVSGRVRFDENGDRRMNSFIIQHRYCTGCNDTLALSEHIAAGGSFNLIELGTYDPPIFDLPEPIVFYGGALAPPPDLDFLCAPGLFYDRQLADCRPCGPGEASEVAGLHVCKQCIPGRVSRDWQQSACESCPAGQFVDSFGATACTTCIRGWFAAAVQSTACEPCAPGTVSESNGSQYCKLCGAGSFNGRAGETACNMCDKGSAAADTGSSLCELCLPGTAIETTGATQCKECDVGSYASGRGWSACTHCIAHLTGATTTMRFSVEEGRWINIQGSTSSSDCGCSRGEHNYSSSGECSICRSDGIDCPGMGIVLLKPGFFSPAGQLSVYRCYGESERCVGGFPGETCASGRIGTTCALCNAGLTPAEDKSCKECEAWDYVPVLVTLVIIIGGVLLVYVFMSKVDEVKRSSSWLLVALATSQLVSALQHVSVLANLSIDWVDPLATSLDSINFITLKITSLRIECWGLQSPAAIFVSQNLLILMGILGFIIVHGVASSFNGRSFGGGQRGLLIGSLTILMIFIYLPMVEMMLGPLQCRRHPNNQWTSRAFPSVVCWEGEEHTWLIAMSVLTSLLPFGFLAHCAVVVWRFPDRVSKADAVFLKSFASVFFRYKPEAYWYILVHLLRSLAVGIVLVLPSAIAQVMTQQFVIIVSAICSARYTPWRVWQANLLDVVLSCLLVAICLWASFFLTVVQDDRRDIAWVLTITIISAIVVLGLACLYAMYLRHLRRTTAYKMVICHHQGSVGALGRLVQLCVDQHSNSTFSGASQTLLDCDLVAGLDKLCETIAHDSQKLVVLACERLWESQLCIAELTIARLKAVPTVVLKLPKYTQPHPHQVVAASCGSGPGCQELTSHGISLAMIEETVQNFVNWSSITLPDRLWNAYVEKLTACLAKTDCMSVKAVEAEPDCAGDGKTVCILASMQNIEASASAYLLLRYLARNFAMTPNMMPYVLPAEAVISSQVRLVAVLLGNGSLECPVFMHSLYSMRQYEAAGIPIIIDSFFQFPSKEQTLERCVKVLGESSGKLVSDLILSLFKEIACLFHPQSASAELLRVQASSIAERLKNPRFIKTSACSSDDAVDQRSSPKRTLQRTRRSTAFGRDTQRPSSGSINPTVSGGVYQTATTDTDRSRDAIGEQGEWDEDDVLQMAATASDHSRVSRV